MMIDQFTSYSTKLERLSNDELHHSAEKLVLTENRTIAKLIAHLAEMSSRKTALVLGYKSLYEYCITGLNLSEGAVPARIHVANVSRRFPQLLIALAESRISLTVAALLAPHLTEDNVDKLISDCAGMKRRETEEYIVAFRPKPVFEPSIRKRPAPAVHVESPAFNVNITGAFTSTRTRRDAEELPNHSAARPSGSFQLPLFGQPGFQGQVRTARRGCGRRQRSETHGRDFGEGARYRAREERPEEEARAAEKEAACQNGQISFKRDREKRRAGRVSIRGGRSCRARSRPRLVPMHLSWP